MKFCTNATLSNSFAHTPIMNPRKPKSIENSSAEMKMTGIEVYGRSTNKIEVSQVTAPTMKPRITADAMKAARMLPRRSGIVIKSLMRPRYLEIISDEEGFWKALFESPIAISPGIRNSKYPTPITDVLARFSESPKTVRNSKLLTTGERIVCR